MSHLHEFKIHLISGLTFVFTIYLITLSISFFRYWFEIDLMIWNGLQWMYRTFLWFINLEITCKFNATPLEMAWCNMMNGVHTFLLQLTLQVSEFIYQSSKSQNIFALGSLCYAGLSCIQSLFLFLCLLYSILYHHCVHYYKILYEIFSKCV